MENPLLGRSFMGKVIIVSGSVGAGKTTTAKFLAKQLHAKYIDVSRIVKQHKEVVAGYDKKRKAKEIDVKKLNRVLIGLIAKEKKDVVIDSHLSHYLPRKYVDHCIICKCNLKELRKRLQKRGYGAEKVRENIDAEIFDVCLVEAAEKGHKLVVVFTDKDIKKQISRLVELYHERPRR